MAVTGQLVTREAEPVRHVALALSEAEENALACRTWIGVGVAEHAVVDRRIVI